ncbi:hypothetical protein BJX61DRAFT_403031 [Aspergillus egyptiacus]|nr:hypothetical protein BJX61DRAFT_403031 [Aspergillus egyptiacus]
MMVKLDVRRDYYADLGLTPSADAEDIKKQFRKLALKYHPDRNPGRELEFNTKFQAIQAAHEILSDSHQRLKYDTERLRNGYYGPRSSFAQKDATPGYASARPNTKAPFSERSKSFNNGPSSGAQRYASYARAAPPQPWEKSRDGTQTRADAYRGFQEMKGNAMPNWSSFDPRARTGQPGAVPRPNATTNGTSARPKSAYEYVRTASKPTAAETAQAQSAKKKQGFAPRAAGGDEPMAANTASYRSAPRFDRERFTPAPSPTSRKPAAGFTNGAEQVNTPEFERASHKYASTGGERTFFSSSMLGRSDKTRNSPKSTSRPRTNPPSPTPQNDGRHRSASPSMKGDRGRNYDSTSSSGLSDEDVSFKPKAVPKSRLRQQQTFANFHTTNGWNTKTAHDSDSAGSARNNSDTPIFSKKADFSFGAENFVQNGGFKSSSHGDLRRSGRREAFGSSQEPPTPNDRGRASTRDTPPKAAGGTSTTAKNDSRPEPAPQQQVPFEQESFLRNDWGEAFKFRGFSDALPNDPSKSTHTQRAKSPRKPTRPGARVRPTPQQPSVATEAEEAESTVDGPAADGEAMDLDDEIPAKTTGTAPAPPEKPGSKPEKTPQSRPSSKSGGKDAADNLLNLKKLSGVFPFTSTNNGGLEDLKDISTTLPFESQAKVPKTTTRGTHPRELRCPNPPKRPEPPQPVPIGAGSKKLAIPRVAMDRYVAEMNTYIREWEAFNGRMVDHFVARHTSDKTEMAPNWLAAVGDSTRLSDDETKNSGDESDDDPSPKGTGTARRGFTSYKNALLQDEKVMKHWEVARERHLECILKYGQMREWVRGGGKIL